jgi:signal transduction histidine kinase
VLPDVFLRLGKPQPRPRLAYSLALFASGTALVLSFVLDPIAQHSPFALFLGAVMVSAWYGGLGPGLLATALAAACINYVFEGPVFSFGVETANAAIDLLMFLLVALLISSLNAHLLEARRRAEEATREADAARNLAEEAVRVRENFLASVAHDLKSPLTVVSGQTQLLRRRVANDQPLDAAALDAGLVRVLAVAGRMRADIDELVDVARLRLGGPLSLRLGPTDLVAIARRVVAAHEDTPDAGRVALSTDAESLVGLWDAARLERVLENLVENALKYSPAPSEVQVSVERQEEGAEAWARIRVQDHGVGIPEDELDRIFEPFQRARNVEGQIRGTGVGLASTRQIVQEHGGRLWVDSWEGVGSTFFVTLPLAPRSADGVRGR